MAVLMVDRLLGYLSDLGETYPVQNIHGRFLITNQDNYLATRLRAVLYTRLML